MKNSDQPSEAESRRAYHRLEFSAAISAKELAPDLKEDPAALRSQLRTELRILQWLQLDNRQALVREPLMIDIPKLAPVLRLIDAKLNFLAAELFSRETPRSDYITVRMSATGIDFPWPAPLPQGSLWLLEIDPVGGGAAIFVPALITRAEENGQEVRVAAKFFALTEDEEDALASWILARQAKELIQDGRGKDLAD